MITDDLVMRRFSAEHFGKALNLSVNYALLSLPYTINRMQYALDAEGLAKRLRNIILGKLPEHLVQMALENSPLRVQFSAGETPFWQQDRFDMLVQSRYGQEEWDIKCLVIEFNRLAGNDWLQLPALIPARHNRDQWAHRNKWILPETIAKRFLFVYLDNPHLVIRLGDEQLKAYERIFANRKMYQHQADMILRMIGQPQVRYEPHEHYRLVISALAGADEWQLFREIPPQTSFLDGLIHTRIKNRGAAIAELPAFIRYVEKEAHS